MFRSALFRRLLKIILIVAIAGLLWCGMLYYKITTFNGTGNPEQTSHADVGIVLGASLWNNEPSPALKERLNYAIELYNLGVFSQILVTGGLDQLPGAKLTEAEGMRNYLLSRNIPDAAISMEQLSTSTYENLLFSKKIMVEKEWATAVIVTHRYHGARAADIADKLGYTQFQVRVTESKVLRIHYHEAREILAFTKWYLDKLFL
ncbi:MAG: YdcF family protein [Candidatus Cohnella colombiensis]|uniref:YdcF family protein n=1 Tax=Candidatus Cohnella colombiensis TaxID=3121368 RepID=A0AA95JD09_9BACL|nr:MAG: YdcF family protein [Cohnella sp.]